MFNIIFSYFFFLPYSSFRSFISLELFKTSRFRIKCWLIYEYLIFLLKKFKKCQVFCYSLFNLIYPVNVYLWTSISFLRLGPHTLARFGHYYIFDFGTIFMLSIAIHFQVGKLNFFKDYSSLHLIRSRLSQFFNSN